MVGRYALLEKAQNHILTHVESVDDQSDRSKPMSYLLQSCAVYGAGIVFSGGYLNRQWIKVGSNSRRQGVLAFWQRLGNVGKEQYSKLWSKTFSRSSQQYDYTKINWKITLQELLSVHNPNLYSVRCRREFHSDAVFIQSQYRSASRGITDSGILWRWWFCVLPGTLGFFSACTCAFLQ